MIKETDPQFSACVLFEDTFKCMIGKLYHKMKCASSGMSHLIWVYTVCLLILRFFSISIFAGFCFRIYNLKWKKLPKKYG